MFTVVSTILKKIMLATFGVCCLGGVSGIYKKDDDLKNIVLYGE